MRLFLTPLLVLTLLFSLTGCSDQSDHIITILSGRGLQKPMEEVRAAFIDKYGIKTHIIYAGSMTLLSAMKRSNQGDVFVPGSLYTLEQAGDMIVRHEPVALHIPVIVVPATNPKSIQSLSDLARTETRVGIAHKQMAALGRTSEEIFTASGLHKEIMANVIIKAQNVTVLLDHIVNDEMDAAILWTDMLLWPETHKIKAIAIAPQFNRVKKIHAALLRQSRYPREAGLFVDFIAKEGLAIFQKYGFEAIP